MPSASPNIHGAHCRDTSQLMQLRSTNQGRRRSRDGAARGSAISEAYDF
jgi:hypothetical protein